MYNYHHNFGEIQFFATRFDSKNASSVKALLKNSKVSVELQASRVLQRYTLII